MERGGHLFAQGVFHDDRLGAFREHEGVESEFLVIFIWTEGSAHAGLEADGAALFGEAAEVVAVEIHEYLPHPGLGFAGVVESIGAAQCVEDGFLH